MTKHKIIEDLFRNPIIDDMIWNITGGHHLKEELKSELFSILLEMPETKIIQSYEGKWLTYLCVNILSKQWKSSTSPFHKKFKKFKWEDIGIDNIPEEDSRLDLETLEKVLDIVDRLPLVERELFKMRWKIDKYDKHFGELRDPNCQKDIYSYRKIEKKLAIETEGGKKYISIDHNTIHKYHQSVIDKIKKDLDDTK